MRIGLEQSEVRLWSRSWRHHPLEGGGDGAGAKSEPWEERRSGPCGADDASPVIRVRSTVFHELGENSGPADSWM